MNKSLDATPLRKRRTPCTDCTIACDSIPGGGFVNQNPTHSRDGTLLIYKSMFARIPITTTRATPER
jgi:hypothetical protein